MNTIYVKNVKIEKYSIGVDFETAGEVSQYFKSNLLSLEYDIEISSLPQSIAVLPFVCNVLPIIWLTDTTLHIPELDKAFYESIKDFKQGFIDMYPMLEFKGSIIVDKLVTNVVPSDKAACFFSGGLDAYATLIAHIDEKPSLLTLRGADVKLDDVEGWENVSKPIIEAAHEFSLDYHFTTTTFRTFIDEGKLHSFVQKIGSPDGWWHGFQHGLGIISHAAPICYIKGISKLYIASSYTPADKGKYTCASDPTIDNFVRFASTKVYHDQYEYNTQQKMNHVCEFVKQTGHKVHMHVCWESRGG